MTAEQVFSPAKPHTHFVDVWAGEDTSFTLDVDGQLHAWGRNDLHQLGK